MILKPISLERYAEKAESHLGVFGSAQWLSVYGNDLRLIGIFRDEQQLLGGFFYLVVKKYGGSFVKLPPYTPHCGLFFTSESKNQSSINSFTKEVMQAVATHFLALKPALIVLAFPSALVDLQPFIWSKFKVVPNYTYRIALSRSFDDLRSHFDPKTRNVINRAQKEQVVVSHQHLDAAQAFAFFKSTLTAAGANVYTQALHAIFTTFAAPSNSFCLSATKEGELQGAVFCVYDKNTCYYLLGGTLPGSVNGANALLVQYSIERAKALGCSVFDFEGSMLRGVEKFFRGFGPELFSYFTANRGLLPLELVLKFKKRELF